MKEMELVCKWYEKAKNDLIVAEHSFEDLYPRQIEISCYHCQQAIEKALKGFLLYNEIDPPKTHNLIMLCQMCMEIDDSFEEILDDCTELTSYGVITRYPNEVEITEAESKIAIRKSKEIHNFCISLIQELKQNQSFDMHL